MLQALGLGGWMYDGLNAFSVLGASGDVPEVPGLGFQSFTIDGQPLPIVTGLPVCLRATARRTSRHARRGRGGSQAQVRRRRAVQYGHRRPLERDCGGARRAAPMDAHFVDCVVTMRLHIRHLWALPPATVPPIFALMYVQAHQLDTDFYDHHFAPGAYLPTQADHDRNWS